MMFVWTAIFPHKEAKLRSARIYANFREEAVSLLTLLTKGEVKERDRDKEKFVAPYHVIISRSGSVDAKAPVVAMAILPDGRIFLSKDAQPA